MQKTLLLTGATGYIGSHAVVAFEQAGYKTIIIDNLSNSSRDTLVGIEKILGYQPPFHEGDIRDQDFLREIFGRYNFDGVVHFAAKKYVIESMVDPYGYFDVNVVGTLNLLKIMDEFSVRKFIFSSTAGVYDSNNQSPPFSEETPKKLIHPYASSKMIIENILEQLSITNKISSLPLRYFNVMGAHPAGLIGDHYLSGETSVIGYLFRTALGIQESFSIYGRNFSTKDGTAIRDYIDVGDLVEGHIAAYKYLDSKSSYIFEPFNLGNGSGVTVHELYEVVKKITKKDILMQYLDARIGDVEVSISLPRNANERLGWVPKVTLEESVANGWKFLQNKQNNIK